MLRSILLLLCLLAPGAASAEADGVDSRTEFPPLGCGSSTTGEGAGCHVKNANPALMVTIDGKTSLGIGGGEDSFGLYTASVPVDFMGLKGAGINVAIDAPNAPGCELEGFAPENKIGFENDPGGPADPVLSHKSSGEPPPRTLFGVWSYQFLLFNCQSPGALLLRVAMNAFDGSGDELGEVWNSSTFDVTVPEPGASALGAAALGAVAALRRRRA